MNKRYTKLWAFVIYQALIDVAANGRKEFYKNKTIENDRKSAANWIMLDDKLNFNSFTNLCDILNLDPDKIRIPIKNKNINEIKKIITNIKEKYEKLF